jgi:hypothetical protein
MNIYLASYILLTIAALWCALYPIYLTMNGRKYTWPWLRLAFILVGASIAPGCVGSTQIATAHDKASYAAWVKHTENPNGLSFDEWKALNRNYVPRSKHERRTIQPETE